MQFAILKPGDEHHDEGARVLLNLYTIHGIDVDKALGTVVSDDGPRVVSLREFVEGYALLVHDTLQDYHIGMVSTEPATGTITTYLAGNTVPCREHGLYAEGDSQEEAAANLVRVFYQRGFQYSLQTDRPASLK